VKVILKEIISIIRLPNCILSGLGVIIGAVLENYYNLQVLFMGFLVGFFITAYSMIINDYYDIEIDRINAPYRPLVSGKINTRTALTLAAVLLISGLTISALLNALSFVIAALFAIISYLYSWKFKRSGLAGNFLVASSMAIPFIYGSIISMKFDPVPFILAGVAFFAGTSREIIKGISDAEGDMKKGVRTLTITRGAKWASIYAFIFMIVAVILSFFPLIYFRFWYVYLILILIVDFYMIKYTYGLVKNPNGNKAIYVKNRILLLMFGALCVFLVSGVLGYAF
jgi:4-hydroxybenzoate polyprenyltransferase and related prenyltransferases